MQPNYFTCTLGQAQASGLTQPDFENINQFITDQAQRLPDKPAFGFAIPPAEPNQDWSSQIWTFKDVLHGSSAIASSLQAVMGADVSHPGTVALICPSTPEFLFSWLGLMRLGYAVLLIAPQCQPAAIAHLCNVCNVSILFCDKVYSSQSEDAATQARDNGRHLEAINLPFNSENGLAEHMSTSAEPLSTCHPAKATEVAYLHHTSGTSSGLPKPIPQSHRAGLGVLPCFPDGKRSATFTTTPLYHGGVADLFRAWASGAMIWLFPGKGVPITAKNVVKCLDIAHDCVKEGLPPVRYFSSVPYVLQMMEANTLGLRHLQNMEIVGVGGAALPVEVGDRLVNQHVNLISRFGSAECGFLMSSHRDYTMDKEWQYLRSGEGGECLRFERLDNGLSELVVVHGWPHMAKTNRDDGSFATADLLAPHENVPNAWRYHSRADSQLTLITGKKFDPAPLEGAIATSTLIEDVLIFGNGQPFPGALLFRSETARLMQDTEVLDSLWPLVRKLNDDSQDHARIPREMLVPMAVLETPLEKSSKGTLIRGAAESRFIKDITEAYEHKSEDSALRHVEDDNVPRVIGELIEGITPQKGRLEHDTDLFAYGVDSVASVQIRRALRQMLPPSTQTLPLSIVEDCGTVTRLAQYVMKQRRGEDSNADEDDDEEALMLRLVDQYSRFVPRSERPSMNGDSGHTASASFEDNHKDALDSRDVIVLTGATGALGAHLLSLYRRKASVSKIYCLVRSTDDQAARERVRNVLDERGLPDLPDGDDKVEILPASLGDQRLGLSQQKYDEIAAKASIVLHVAWSVNFRMRLRSFVKDNIASVTNLINLALKSTRPHPAKFGYCSSVASVLGCEGIVPEKIIDDLTAPTRLGYSRSKWVAEQICQRAAEQTPLNGRIAVFRVGQLSGDSELGIWNTKEAWPMMLSSVKLTRTLPALRGEALDWLPVDIAALALMQGIELVEDGSGEQVIVLHVLNENFLPKWDDLLGWLKKQHQDFDVVSPSEWVTRLEDAQEKDGANHPALKLLDHWKRAYANSAADARTDRQDDAAVHTAHLDMTKTKHLIPVLRNVKPLDEEYFTRVWRWINKHMSY